MAIESPILDEIKQAEQVSRPEYSDQELDYLKGLRKRLENARNARDQQHNEFDGMDYLTYYEENEKLANTFIKPKINKEDTNFQSGVVRQKLFALLSAIVNLDLRGDISAFDRDGFEVQALGDAIEDVILKTNELDTDDEKKYLRQYELLKHGTVFVEELWDEKWKVSKTKKKFKGSLKEFKKIEGNLKKAFARPTRNIVPGLNVYLGDITQYDISQQPYIFTVDTMPYEEARRMFEKWDRWENVSRKIQQFEPNEGRSIFNYDWTLLEVEQDFVEIVRYQDKWSNEFALLLNGVLMTPVGLPLPWGYEDYNIAQQNLEPIHSKFAYGKSLVNRTRNKVAILDEMMRLAILKTQKSFMPPYLNISGRVLSNRVFMPGKISYGIPPNTLVPINDKETQGLTNSELAMIQELQESINAETVSPTFQGQASKGDPTATEIIELQRQAKMILGLTVFAVSMLEWKLEWLRLKNILANWFSAEDQVVDEARGLLKPKFRKIATDQMIEGEGQGKRVTIPTKEVPSAEAIMQAEDFLTQEQGTPIRLIFLNPEEVTSSRLIWQIVIKPKERKTSEVSKLMFRSFLQDIIPLQPNIDYLREKAASVWEENAQKLFAPEIQPMIQSIEDERSELGIPNPERLMGREINQALKVGV